MTKEQFIVNGCEGLQSSREAPAPSPVPAPQPAPLLAVTPHRPPSPPIPTGIAELRAARETLRTAWHTTHLPSVTSCADCRGGSRLARKRRRYRARFRKWRLRANPDESLVRHVCHGAETR